MSGYKQRALELFDRLDVDGSGEVGADDVQTLVARLGGPATEAGKSMQAAVLELLKDADRRGDGALDKTELLMSLERAVVGKTSDTMGAGFRALASTAFGLMDTAGTGKVGKAEFEQYLKARNVTDTSAADEFTELDRDNDGTLTADNLLVGTFDFLSNPNPINHGKWLLALFNA